MKRKYGILIMVIILIMTITSCEDKKSKDKTPCQDENKNGEEVLYKKPVIYLYPKEEQEVKVDLDYDGELTCTYPEYKSGWQVVASPEGTLRDMNTGRSYSYLYWEGENDYDWQIDEGFVVKGEDTVEFLQEKLEFLGLKPREYNEFIVYWLPLMQDHEYNLIYFAGEEYWDMAELKIDPKPDSIQRVFMVFKGIEEVVEVKEQVLEPFERKGFGVIEWGGMEIE